MKDIIKAAAVNFKAAFGDKKANLEKILCFIEEAAREGADIITLPELCLTGYDALTSDKLAKEEKAALCEDENGESVKAVKAAAKGLGIYAAFGFGEKRDGLFYNSAALCTPQGEAHIYRKIHLFGREGLFFQRGSMPLLADTPWGLTSVGICFDTYSFPEIIRYYAYKGARLYLNPTAIALEEDSGEARESLLEYYSLTLKYDVVNTGLFIVSSNLTGQDGELCFNGGSVVLGPEKSRFGKNRAVCFAGDFKEAEEGLFVGEIDLSLCRPKLFVPSPITGVTAFKPELYAGFYKNCD